MDDSIDWDELEPQVVCAWCSKVIKDGTEPASHGICGACLELELSSIEAWGKE